MPGSSSWVHIIQKMKQFCCVILFGSLILRLLYGQYTFGTYLGNKKCVDFFMYYLECKSTVETLMSGCPFGIPKHKHKWSSWRLGESLRISLANADPHLCILCRLLLHRRQGRSYKRDRSCCTRGIHGWWHLHAQHANVEKYLNIVPGHSLDEVYCKTHHLWKKTKN